MSKTLFETGPEAPEVTALAPWFGSNRMLGKFVGEELRGCKWVGVPFAGGMSELVHVKASTIVVSDLHRHVINLANVVATQGARLREELELLAFHPDTLQTAQQHCQAWEEQPDKSLNYEAAKWYFVACWMGRSHKCGIDDEFNGGVSIRWNANGGDSNKRYRSAVASLDAWVSIMKRCNFSVLDCFDFLDRCEDAPRHGVYLDPPFPGPGDRYKHRFTEEQHRRLAVRLLEFKNVRIVCRFYDHPLVREIYPQPKWTWSFLKGRTQANTEAPEVLIINGASNA